MSDEQRARAERAERERDLAIADGQALVEDARFWRRRVEKAERERDEARKLYMEANLHLSDVVRERDALADRVREAREVAERWRDRANQDADWVDWDHPWDVRG